MYCSKCGKKQNEGANFCHDCGFKQVKVKDVIGKKDNDTKLPQEVINNDVLSTKRDIFIFIFILLISIDMLYEFLLRDEIRFLDKSSAYFYGAVVLGVKGIFVYACYRLSRRLRQPVWLTTLYCILGIFTFVYIIPFICLLESVRVYRKGNIFKQPIPNVKTEDYRVPEISPYSLGVKVSTRITSDLSSYKEKGKHLIEVIDLGLFAKELFYLNIFAMDYAAYRFYGNTQSKVEFSDGYFWGVSQKGIDMKEVKERWIEYNKALKTPPPLNGETEPFRAVGDRFVGFLNIGINPTLAAVAILEITDVSTVTYEFINESQQLDVR